MSTLTKVFVVLLVVFGIAFSMMTISVVSRTASWKDNAEKAETTARIAETNLRNLIAAHAAQIASLKDTIRADREELGDLQQQVEAATNGIAEQKAELAQSVSEKSSAEAINRGLLSQLQAAQTVGEEFRAQRNSLETRNIDLEQRNNDLNDRVNELTARLAVLTEQQRQYEQQINILKDENEALAAAARRPGSGAVMEAPSGAALAGTTAETPMARTAVRGKVLRIDGNVVTISVGSSDGVKKGMLFVIHRDGQYVGDVKIGVVDPNESAGRLGQYEIEPKVDDQITDAASLGSSHG